MIADARPHTSPTELNAIGLAALREGRPVDAVQHFSDATKLDPTAAPLWRNLATAHRELGDNEGERLALDQALSIDRTDFSAWLRKAQLHQRTGDDAAAMAAWSATLQLAMALPSLPPEIASQIAEGQALLDGWQAKLASAVDGTLASFTNTSLSEAERRRGNAFVDLALRRRKTYTNQCSGLFYPFLPPDEFFDADHFPWLDILRDAAPAVREEFLALRDAASLPIRPYVQMDAGSPANVWSTLDGSLDWGAAFLWEYGNPNEELLALCPATAAMLDAVPRADIPGRAPTAFFSILRAGAHIPPHTGVSNTRAIVHLPLIVPEGCGFRVGDETRPWIEGKPFVFDDTIEHEAWNRGASDRAVLIFDVWNPHLTAHERDLIVDYYRTADGLGLNPEARDI